MTRRWARLLAPVAVFLTTALCIVWFYGLVNSGPLFPFLNYRQESLGVIVTSAVAAAVTSLCIAFGFGSGSRTRLRVALRTGIATVIALIAYGVLGWRTPATTLLNPAPFFAETNWLTFVCEVAPAMAFFASLISLLLPPRRRPISETA